VAYHQRRIAAHDRSGRHDTAHNGTKSNNSTGTNTGAWGEYSASCDPGVGANRDRAEAEVETWGAKIVVACAEIGALGDADTITKGDRSEAVEPGIFRQPAGLSDVKTPGELDPQTWFDTATAADSGAEDTQQQYSPSGAR
jgi:hypothetical protein